MGVSTRSGGRLTPETGWRLAQALFVNPSYLGPPDRNTGVADGTGVQINGAAIMVQFDGTYSGQTVVHEQTLDPDGLTGWVAIVGQIVSTAPTTPASSFSASGAAYVFPVIGMRHRIRVTALSSGTMIVYASQLADVAALGSSGGGGGGGGDVNIAQVGGVAVTAAGVPTFGAGSRNFTSLSSTITLGGSAQNLISAASGFSYVELSNPSSATESLFFNDTGAACTNNPAVDTEIYPGGTYIWSAWGTVPVPTDAISIGAATTAHSFSAKRV